MPAINWLAQEATSLTGMEVEVSIGAIPSLLPETQLVLFRVAQEALNNVQRHSGASRASITVESNGAEVRVTISDNGRGFKLPRQLSDFAAQGKLGLTGMAERVRLVGGQLDVSSQLDRGTKLTVRAPISLGNQGPASPAQ